MRQVHRPSLALLLATLLLVAQAFALVHRVEHALPDAIAAAQADGLFDEHEAGDPTCRLIDQVAQADGLATAVSTTAAEPPAAIAAVARSAVVTGACPPAYFARGPPARA